MWEDANLNEFYPMKTHSIASTRAKPYRNSFSVSYWWRCESFLGGIPKKLAEALDETAQERATKMIKEGYQSGELVDCVGMTIDGTETPEDGFECRGWWKLKSK